MVSRFSPVGLFATLWTVARRAPLSMELSRQESWSGLPRPPPGDLPDAVIEPLSPCISRTAGRFSTAEPQGKPQARLEWALNSVTGDFIRRDHVITKAAPAGMLPQAKEHLKPPEAGSGKEAPSPRFQTAGLQKRETRNLHHAKPLGAGPLLQEPVSTDHAVPCLSEHWPPSDTSSFGFVCFLVTFTFPGKLGRWGSACAYVHCVPQAWHEEGRHGEWLIATC